MSVFIKVDIWANIYSKNEGVQEMKKIIYAACLAAVLFGTVSCKMADEEKEIERRLLLCAEISAKLDNQMQKVKEIIEDDSQLT